MPIGHSIGILHFSWCQLTRVNLKITLRNHYYGKKLQTATRWIDQSASPGAPMEQGKKTHGTPREYHENTKEIRSEYEGNTKDTPEHPPSNRLATGWHMALAWLSPPFAKVTRALEK